MAGVENVIGLLSAIYKQCENVAALKEACGRLRNIVAVFEPLLRAYLNEMQGKSLPAWERMLQDALSDGLDAVQFIKSNPIRAKAFPSSYTGKLEAVRSRIHEAMQAISLTIIGAHEGAGPALEPRPTRLRLPTRSIVVWCHSPR